MPSGVESNLGMVYYGSGVITENGVNLRRGPGTSYESQGMVNKGDTLELTRIYQNDARQTWYLVRMTSGNNNGMYGWVISDFIKIS